MKTEESSKGGSRKDNYSSTCSTTSKATSQDKATQTVKLSKDPASVSASSLKVAVSPPSFKAATSSGITHKDYTSDGSSTASSSHRVPENPKQKKHKKEE